MAPNVCQRCGAELPDGASFCPRCGAPVAVLTTGDRKVVTVLFADIAGSTELASRTDPERFAEVIAAFYSMAASELDAFRGRVEKFVGDAVMAVFGLPHSHEDDAVRAVRAAFAIRDGTATLGDRLSLPVPLRVRIGINSGPVATGAGAADQFLVSGVAVNVASRLEAAADPGEILVSETTWQLSRLAIEYGPQRTIEAKGIDEPLLAWPALGVSASTTRRTIPLVDRRRELALLTDAFERVRETGKAHMVTILGEPGVGKSRVVEELIAGLPGDAHVLTGRASDYEDDPTFAPLADMIRRELRVDPGAPRAEVRRRLEEVVEGCCLPSESEQVVGRLGLLLGIGSEDVERPEPGPPAETVAQPDSDPVPGQPAPEGSGDDPATGRGERLRYRTAAIRSGFETLLDGMSRTGPVIVVFEDLHVARPELLDLIEHVQRSLRRLPLLTICVARDWLLDTRPDWGGGIADSIVLRLEPLTHDQAVALAERAGGTIDASTAERIARQTGGNPFFIVETAGMLLQQHEEHLAGILHSHLLPPTVQAVVAARLDHLPPEARELARRASVFGRSTFHESDLRSIAEVDPATLAVLEDEGILVRDAGHRDGWRFAHDLLRDVAYDSLPKRERQRLHVLVADALIRDAGTDRFRSAVAYHLAQAARASLDLDPTARELPDRAVKALTRAADAARRRMDSRTAVDLYEQALALAGPEASWGTREARILAGIGEARYWLGEFADAEAALRRALDLGSDDAWTRTLASRFLGDIALNVHADPDAATALFDAALDAADELEEPFAKARTYLMAGWAPFWRGDLEGARKSFEQALEIARANPEGDRWAEARALVSLTSVTSPVGDERECLALSEQALALGEEMGDPFTAAVAHEHVANSLRRMLRLDEALPHVEQAVATFRDLEARWELASAVGDRGEIHRLRGDLDAAERDLREALDLCRRLGERSLITWTVARLALVLLTKGDGGAARQVLDDPAAHAEAEPGSRVTLLATEALLARSTGDAPRAVDLAREAVRLERDEGWPNPIAAVTWWAGRLFGPDVAGGDDEVERARRTLERAHWLAALAEPDLAPR